MFGGGVCCAGEDAARGGDGGDVDDEAAIFVVTAVVSIAGAVAVTIGVAITVAIGVAIGGAVTVTIGVAIAVTIALAMTITTIHSLRPSLRLSLHIRHNMFRQQKRPTSIHRHDPIPQRRITRARRIKPIHDTRIVHHNIEPPKLGHGCGDEFSDGLFVSDVSLEQEGAVCVVLVVVVARSGEEEEVLACSGEALAVDVAYDDVGALGEEGFGNGAAETASSAGDEDGFANMGHDVCGRMGVVCCLMLLLNFVLLYLQVDCLKSDEGQDGKSRLRTGIYILKLR